MPEAMSEASALHCHDTRGQTVANNYASLERGIRIFDSAAPGLGRPSGVKLCVAKGRLFGGGRGWR